MVNAGNTRRESTQAYLIPLLKQAGFNVVADNCDADCVFQQRLPGLDYDLGDVHQHGAAGPVVPDDRLRLRPDPDRGERQPGSATTPVGATRRRPTALHALRRRAATPQKRTELIHEALRAMDETTSCSRSSPSRRPASGAPTRWAARSTSETSNFAGFKNFPTWEDLNGDGKIVIGAEQWPGCLNPVTRVRQLVVVRVDGVRSRRFPASGTPPPTAIRAHEPRAPASPSSRCSDVATSVVLDTPCQNVVISGPVGPAAAGPTGSSTPPTGEGVAVVPLHRQAAHLGRSDAADRDVPRVRRDPARHRPGRQLQALQLAGEPAKIEEYIEANGLYEGFGGYVRGYFQWLGGFLTGDWPNSIKGNREVLAGPEGRPGQLHAPGRHRRRCSSITVGLHARRARRTQARSVARRRHQHHRAGRCCRSRRSSRRSSCRWCSPSTPGSGSPTPRGCTSRRPACTRPARTASTSSRWCAHLMLPVIVVAIQTIAVYTRYMRASLLDVLEQRLPAHRPLEGHQRAHGCSCATPCATPCCRSSPWRRSTSAPSSAA